MKLSPLLSCLNCGQCPWDHVCFPPFINKFFLFSSLSVLNVEQFQRFMLVIKKLGDRVEKEHDQFLRDSQRLEDRSATAVNGASGPKGYAASVDFESLVGRANGAIKADTMIDANKSWDDDVWGSIFNSEEVSRVVLEKVNLTFSFQTSRVQSPPTVAAPSPSSPRSSISAIPSPPKLSSLQQRSSQYTTPNAASSFTAVRQSSGFSGASLPLQPMMVRDLSQPTYSSPIQAPPPKPNYNISLQNTAPPIIPTQPSQPNYAVANMAAQSFAFQPLVATPPAMGSLLAPSKPLQPSWGNSTKKPSKDDWGDFDPLA